MNTNYEMLNGIFKRKLQKLSFEDVQSALKSPDHFLIINTLKENEQHCLIRQTLYYQNETRMINDMIIRGDLSSKRIIIYGKNANDESIEQKYHQICGLGFVDVFIYPGGLFEWLCLQDIYGDMEFPTTSKELDILKYKPTRLLL